MFTKPLTIDGWTLLSTAMAAASYTGTNALSFLQLINTGATPVYIHLTTNGVTNPATGSDGVPIGSAEPSVEWSFDQAGSENFLDAGTTWLYSASSVDIKVAAIGGGI